MNTKYTVCELNPCQFVALFPFAKTSIIESGYRFWPPMVQGCFKVKVQNQKTVALCYSRYFNEGVRALLKSIRNIEPDATIKDVVQYAQRHEYIFPSLYGIKLDSLISRLAKEYVYIGLKERGVVTPLLNKIRENNYVQGGLVHILLRHYAKISGFGMGKGSLFSDETINEVLGGVIRAIVEGKQTASLDDRVRIEVSAQPGSRKTISPEPYYLVLEPTSHPETFTTVTFFPKGK